MTTYAAGLRLTEVRHLRPVHIHSQRLLIRVEQGKGQKDRYTLLSPQLLQELRAYWREYRPGEWLFPNQKRSGPILRGTAQKVFYNAKRRAGLQRGHGIHTLRHCFATHLLEAGVHKPDDPSRRWLWDLARPLLTAALSRLNHAAGQNLEVYEHLHQVRILGKRLRYAME